MRWHEPDESTRFPGPTRRPCRMLSGYGRSARNDRTLCLAWPAWQSGPETVREPEEVLLVDCVEQCGCRPLDNLVFQGGDRERALPAVRLRYVLSPGRQCPIRSPLDARVQVMDTSAFPQSDGVGCSTKLRSTTSERPCFRSGSHSIMLRPPSLLPPRSFPPLASTLTARAAAAFTSEQNAVRYLPAHRIC
jgi:hypothetical protein